MSKKVTCKKCKTSHDSDILVCPVCGEKLEDISSEENDLNQKGDASINTSNESNKQENESISPVKNFFIGLVKFPSRELKVESWKNVTLFLTGWLGFTIFAFISALIVVFLYSSLGLTLDETAYSAALSYGGYFILLGVLLLILSNNILELTEDFKKPMIWFKGLYYGVILIVVSVIVGLIFQSLSPIETTVNENEEIAELITISYPVLSIIVLGVLGPICEEFTYRIGLFSGLKRVNRVLAYVVCALIFGFIHFSFDFEDTNNLINELINIPQYIVAGLLLCYFYEKSGIATSIIAHCTNNLFSVIITLLYFYVL